MAILRGNEWRDSFSRFFVLRRSKFFWRRRAWRRYGKDRHAAGLNQGDRFAHALAKTRGKPLLDK